MVRRDARGASARAVAERRRVCAARARRAARVALRRDAVGCVGNRGVRLDCDHRAAAARPEARDRSSAARGRDRGLCRRLSDLRAGTSDVLVCGRRAAARRSTAARAAHVVSAAAVDRGRRAPGASRAASRAARRAQSRRLRLRAVAARHRTRRDGLCALRSARGARGADDSRALGSRCARGSRNG